MNYFKHKQQKKQTKLLLIKEDALKNIKIDGEGKRTKLTFDSLGAKMKKQK